MLVAMGEKPMQGIVQRVLSTHRPRQMLEISRGITGMSGADHEAQRQPIYDP